MAYGAPQDNSSGDSAVHPLPTDPSAGATRPSARPLESHDCPAPYSATVGKLYKGSPDPNMHYIGLRTEYRCSQVRHHRCPP